MFNNTAVIFSVKRGQEDDMKNPDKKLGTVNKMIERDIEGHDEERASSSCGILLTGQYLI